MRIESVDDSVVREIEYRSYGIVVVSRLGFVGWWPTRLYARFYWDRDRNNPYVHYIEADKAVGPHHLGAQQALKRFFEGSTKRERQKRERDRKQVAHRVAHRFDNYWTPSESICLPEARIVKPFGCSSECRAPGCGGGCSQ